MSLPLGYLLVTKFKNQIRSFFKSPVKIIYLGIILLLIGVNMFSGRKLEADPDRIVRDIGELSAIVTVFYSLMFVLLAIKGFKTGGSMFSMADVNLIFPAPFKQQNVLFYGLFQQMGTSLLLGLFLFFQYSWMHNLYDVTLPMLLVILLGYTLTVFFGQITAMVLYTFTSADEKRKTVCKSVFYALVGCFIIYVSMSGIADKSQFISRATAAVNGCITWFFPVSGWTGHAVSGVFMGNIPDILLGLSVCAAYLVLLVCLMTYTRQDYYEDVLKSSEIMQSAITARKEGRFEEAVPQNIKVGKTGLGHGWGANALYYKHKLENRRARVFILDTVSLIFAAVTIALAFFMKSAGIAAIFITATTMQIFSVALGRFNKELTKPYIYLIPEPPLQKILYALAEAVPSWLTEAFIIFVPVTFILGLPPVETLLCILARLSFALLFTAGNIAVERLWGGSASKTVVMLLYFTILLVMAAPGIVLAVVMTSLNVLANENIAILLSLMVINIPVSLLVLFLCRNMLQYAELNQK